MEPTLSPLSKVLIETFEKDELPNHDKKITVNRLISEVASWYEKIRTVMDYREEAVILRASIERILKRRLILGGTGKTIASPLLRELIWARYFPDASVPESIIEKIANSIDLHLKFKEKILEKTAVSDKTIDKFVKELMSADIEKILNPNKEKEAMTNFMFHVLKDSVAIEDDTKETRDAQVFISVLKAFSRDDLAFLHFRLFRQYFGILTWENIDETAQNFNRGFEEIGKQLNYKRKDRIFNYIKKQTPPFLILDDILRKHKGNFKELIKTSGELPRLVFEDCSYRYDGISSSIRRAIIRSFIFILLTKAFFALSVEGTYDRVVYGHIIWSSIALNIFIPPTIMALAGFMIKKPGDDNSKRILSKVEIILFEEKPRLAPPISVRLTKDTSKPMHDFIFSVLWFLAFVMSFGGIISLLTKLQFNIVSQAIFIFFLTIIAFLTYRINQIAHTYSVGEKQSMTTPIVDFLFMPVVRVGRRLTEGISQINLFLFFLDFVFETPFKGIFAFFEQWFLFLHAKREELE
ncbi:MAG: hypothetical protein Q8P80_00145 [Candidatus Levybacteria bacterium]|nr:hypothetical protein [Candidatus Levybacteria bacterium]